MRIPRATIEIANSAIAAGTMSAPMLSIAHISLSTYRVAPSTRTTITRVPGSSAVSMIDAARQSSPSTCTRPFPVPGSMRSDTIPSLPASAAPFVPLPLERERRRPGPQAGERGGAGPGPPWEPYPASEGTGPAPRAPPRRPAAPRSSWPRSRANVDALAGKLGIVSERIDPGTGKGIHVRPDPARARVQVPEEKRADTDEGEQRAGREAQHRDEHAGGHERDQSGREAPHGDREQPETRRGHLGDEQEQRRDEPGLPCVHGREVSVPCLRRRVAGPPARGPSHPLPPTPSLLARGTPPPRPRPPQPARA